jgi:hypothetical protein
MHLRGRKDVLRREADNRIEGVESRLYISKSSEGSSKKKIGGESDPKSEQIIGRVV